MSLLAQTSWAGALPTQPPTWQSEPIQLLLRQKSGGITQAQAAQIAKKRHGGKVLSVTRKGGDSPAYKVKLLLKDGRVKVVTVDAKSGAAR